MKNRFPLITCLILLILLPETLLFAQNQFLRQSGTNPNYNQGDWISYSVARFVSSIAVGRQYVYFGTAHSGILRLDQYQFTWEYPFTTSNGLADNQIWTVAYDLQTDFIWCASHTAISYYQTTSRRWTNYFKDEFGMSVSDEIESIGVGNDKIVFEARSGRIFSINKFGGVVLEGNQNDSRDSSIKWFGRRAQRRVRYPNFFMSDGYIFSTDGVVEDYNFRKANIVASVEDDWGNLWVATWGLGPGRGNLRNQQLEMYDFGLANYNVDAINFAGDVMWIGGIGGSVGADFENLNGITAWDTRRQEWTYYDQRHISEIRNDDIYSISPDEDDVWFGTRHGLLGYRIRKGNWQYFDSFKGLSDNQIYDTAIDDSTIWIGTANGIDRLFKRTLDKEDTLRIDHISPGNLTLARVYDLELVENLLWAATDRGVYVYDIAKSEGGFSDEFEGPINDVTSISRFENEVWFGSDDGVDVFDMEAREWLGVTEGRRLSTPVNKVLASRDAVWAATNQGVMKYDRHDQNWRTFTVEDGLLDNHVNTILLDGDYIWFGTDAGLTQFFWNAPGRID